MFNLGVHNLVIDYLQQLFKYKLTCECKGNIYSPVHIGIAKSQIVPFRQFDIGSVCTSLGGCGVIKVGSFWSSTWISLMLVGIEGLPILPELLVGWVEFGGHSIHQMESVSNQVITIYTYMDIGDECVKHYKLNKL
jgi:hypothetical protein